MPLPSDKTAGPPQTVLRVLVVEDEALHAEQVEAVLLGMGCEPVGPAASAQVALALYRTEPVDLVLLDIGLRGPTNGLQLAQQLLAHHRVPLIFLTSFASEEAFAQAQALKPAAYLTKPLDAAALRRAMLLAVNNQPARAWPAHAEAATPGPVAGRPMPETVFVKENGLLEKVNLSEVHSVAANNKMCSLVLAGRSLEVRMPLRELARLLPAERFVQIQRSYFINLEHIERLDPARHLVQVGKQVLPVGRLYLPELISRLYTLT